jgi:hypothetical protein
MFHVSSLSQSCQFLCSKVTGLTSSVRFFKQDTVRHSEVLYLMRYAQLYSFGLISLHLVIDLMLAKQFWSSAISISEISVLSVQCLA